MVAPSIWIPEHSSATCTMLRLPAFAKVPDLGLDVVVMNDTRNKSVCGSESRAALPAGHETNLHSSLIKKPLASIKPSADLIILHQCLSCAFNVKDNAYLVQSQGATRQTLSATICVYRSWH